MGVHEVRYGPFEGQTTPALRRWIAIPRFTLMAAADRMFILSLLGVGALPLVGMTLYLVVINTPMLKALLGAQQVTGFPADVLMRSLLRTQFWLSLPMLMILVPKLVTTERQHQALPLIHSRPITPLGYMTGKAMAAFLPLSVLSWIPALILGVVMMLTYPRESPFWTRFVSDSLPMMAGAVTGGMAVSILMALVVVAASAITKNARFAAGTLAAFLLGSGLMGDFLGDGVAEWLRVVGLPQLANALYLRLVMIGTGESAMPLPAIAASAILWVAASLLVTRHHLRIVTAHRD